MPQLNDLSRSLATLDQDSTIIAVVELSQSSWLVAGVLLSFHLARSDSGSPGEPPSARYPARPSPACPCALLPRGSCDTFWLMISRRVIGPPPGFRSSGRQGFFGVVLKASINSGLTHPGQQSVPPVIAAKAQNERRRFAKGRICQAWQSA